MTSPDGAHSAEQPRNSSFSLPRPDAWAHAHPPSDVREVIQPDRLIS